MRNKHNNRYNRGGFRRPPRNTSGFKTKKTFDPTPLVGKAANPAPLEVIQIKHQFADFAISQSLKNNIIHKGYQTPTPIQDQIIPYILEGRDVVGLANTGTGKTAAFLIPLIEKIIKDKSFRVLVVAPTRELAAQIQDEMQGFSYGLQINSALIIGGVSMDRQIEKLSKSPHFIIGTPGRIKDLSQRRKLKLETMKAIVLDEVDQMLDMGFIHDIKTLISMLPSQRHSLFFSATLPDNVRSVMQSFLTNPVTVSVKTGDILDNIDQDVIKVANQSKVDLLADLLSNPDFSKVLVFGGTKWKLNKLERALRDKGFKVTAIHGNKTQSQRQKALEQFKKHNIQALLATDVASRGIDIENVTHVINFDMPTTYEDYIHRIGRTGRANRTGKAITFVD